LVFSRLFRRSSRPSSPHASWWTAAEAAAEAADPGAIEALRQATAPDAPLDEVEQQQEMLEGLELLGAIADRHDLPVVETQHRVIGDDTCHLVAPATLMEEQAVPGKLFLTNRRVVFAGGRARHWPWHRVRDVTRDGRFVSLVVAAPDDVVPLQCNAFGDALAVRYLAQRLSPHRATRSG
jgi:hypothetical protein